MIQFSGRDAIGRLEDRGFADQKASGTDAR